MVMPSVCPTGECPALPVRHPRSRTKVPFRYRRAMPRLLALTVSDAPGTWAGLGFTLDAIAVRIGGTAVVCSNSAATASDGPRGITDWMLSADDGPLPERIDGLLTGSVTRGDASPPIPAPATRHVNGVESIDHLVVMTPDVDRTIAA